MEKKYILEINTSYYTAVNRDQTASSVMSNLVLHSRQKVSESRIAAYALMLETNLFNPFPDDIRLFQTERVCRQQFLI